MPCEYHSLQFDTLLRTMKLSLDPVTANGEQLDQQQMFAQTCEAFKHVKR